MEFNGKTSIRGKIVSKKCECCSHHEIGIETEDGRYIQLKHGMEMVGYLGYNTSETRERKKGRKKRREKERTNLERLFSIVMRTK